MDFDSDYGFNNKVSPLSYINVAIVSLREISSAKQETCALKDM